MAGLVYRRDMDAVRARLTTWWNGGDIGRPVMQIRIPRKEPHPGVPEIPAPDGVTAPWYTTRSFDWDGPGAIPHHDHLLGLPRLNVIQWTAGSGAEPGWHRRWWPLFHKTFERGKGVFIGVSGSEQETVERLTALKREFGPRFKRFMFDLSMPSSESAERLLAQMSTDW